MIKAKNKREFKGILIPKDAHKRLITVKNELDLKTVGHTIIRLIELREELMDKEDSFKTQQENMIIMRKRLEVLEETKGNNEMNYFTPTAKVPDIVNEDVE